MSDPKHYYLEESIGYIVRNFTIALRKRLISNLNEAGFYISIEEWIVLTFLWRFPGKNQAQIGDFLNQDKTAVTRLLDLMEKNETVVREVSEEDKRNKLLKLTDKGKMLYANLLPHIEKTLETAYSGLNEKDIEICKSSLLKMQENLLDDY